MGMGYKRQPDYFHDRFQFVQHLIVPQSHNPKARMSQSPIASFISGRIHVLTAIYLDHQLDFQANEIKDEIAKRMLAPEFMTVELAAAQSFPQRLFGVRHVAA